MDPLSIASGAAGLAISCATIVKTLYTWIDDTVDVDENVSNLLEEVTILSRVLDSVSNASGRVPQAIVAEIDPGNALWGSISATLDDIQNTFDKLKQLMAELEKTNRFSRGFLRKPTKQIKFSLRSKDITIYKDRIKSYNTAMTSAFQMLNICLLIHSNSSQDSVFKVLSGLKSQLRNVEVALHTSSSASPGPSSGREEDDRATQNLRQFVQVAENFHSSASTILREGPRSTVWGGSIMGDPLTEAQTSLIERWIPPPVNEEPHSPLDADSDSETEFARRFEELAIKNEVDGDHAKAEQFYRGAIEHGESSSRPVSDITAIKIRLAYVCMRQEKWTEADEIISPIAFERKTNDILVYHGMHALALAYVDDSKLEEAERYCKRALWGKRKVLGKDNLSCWETLTLLVFICKARNRTAEAEVHRSFIPNYETIAIDPEALTYLERSVGSLGRSSNDSDMITKTQQPSAFQQEYPPSQPYATAASGPVPSAGGFQYPKTLGSQYTSPPTPSSHQGMVQHATQDRQTRSNGESSSNPALSRKAIGPPDLNSSTMNRPLSMGQYYQQRQTEQSRRSTDLSYVASSLLPPPHSTRAYIQPSLGANNYEPQGYQSPPPLSPYGTAPVPKPEPQYQIFVSIDFMNIDGASTSVAYIPTVIYYDQYNKVAGWGCDIADAIAPTGDLKPGIQKVEGLPLLLAQEKEDSTPLPAVPPGLNAVDVSADFLFEVRRALRTQLQQRLGRKFLDNEQTIHWIVTLSEIWAKRNKDLWKRALQRAGYLRDENDTRLSFIGEAEASINHAIMRYSLIQETYIFASFGKEIAHVSVCTLPVAPHHFVSRLVSNENQGPALIAHRFAQMARTKIKRMRLPDSSRLARRVFGKCIDDFEDRILSEFRNNGQEWDIDVAVEAEFPDAGIKNGFMTYTNDEILSCFQPVIDGITTMMAHAIGEVFTTGNVLEGIVLAGEYCTSEYLLREIKSKLPADLRNKVYPPMEPATQVVLGAAHLELSRYLSSGRGYVKHER
ncbi:uncharacterized protein FPRO_06561 [Fusarium proliferatum ET1]|uniref:Azaphilone pigments biosynthesis cluster protein L N-terminal domain-containing protein n=1 Tax=Fusarium proliferatum (strain ET1) TaxID=1227346 RepID=A0A1L7VBZ5_FUSPR|nr:uncharacterized protein FPRO_06561 [Fusarium proliferatum ET1]CZR38248.1 uncharacterized protein FPRO_06561 [Fusarium proliferatum ET1]